MPVMSPGNIVSVGKSFWVCLLVWTCLVLSAVVSGQDQDGGSDKEDWLMTCCGDEPIRENRTLVNLGYLTAVKGDLRNRSVHLDICANRK